MIERPSASTKIAPPPSSARSSAVLEDEVPLGPPQEEDFKLPGSNPYDAAARKQGQQNWNRFKAREDTRRAMSDADKAACAAKLENMAVEERELDLAVKRGKLVTKEKAREHMDRLVVTFRTLMQFLFESATPHVDASKREDFLRAMRAKQNLGMTLIADAIAQRKSPEWLDAELRRAIFGVSA
jgi:hypothetical protein